MKITYCNRAMGVVFLAVLLLFCSAAYAENIDPDADGHKYAWGENVGWLNAEPQGDGGPGVEVGDVALTGYVWSENAGWINLSPSNCGDCGVVNDGSGNLSGYAWGENVGWISFSSSGSVTYGVVIDPATGVFTGKAWGENIGWISFDYTGYETSGVKTAWMKDSDGDGTPDVNDGCPDDPDKIAAGICGCGVADTDTDGDGTADCIDAFPNEPGETLDNDGDGTGDNADTDDDNDGMPDDWEAQYGLNPLVDDALGDPDGDGVSNIDEYDAGWDPTQPQVNPPVLFLPVDGETDVSLTPDLETEAFSDPDPEDIHFETRWQISTASDFSDDLKTVLDVTCGVHLTTVTVPELILDVDTTYYWRVKFYDDRNGESEWSLPFSFTTISASDSQDTDQNGIPDDLENNFTDLDGDGIPDVDQADIKCCDTVVGDGQVGIKMSTNVISIDAIRSIDPDDIPDTDGRPKKLRFGLIGFKIHVANPGAVAGVTVYFSKQADRKEKWFKYDAINGWQDYSDHAVFSRDRKSVVLTVKDGGFGDADGTANGIIVDPSGAGTPTPAGASGGGGGGCFVATLSNEWIMEPYAKAFIFLTGFGWVGIVGIRRRFRK